MVSSGDKSLPVSGGRVISRSASFDGRMVHLESL